MLGLVLLVATPIWFFYLVPLGRAMNTTGCRQAFTVWSVPGRVHFWAPFLVALLLLASAARSP